VTMSLSNHLFLMRRRRTSIEVTAWWSDIQIVTSVESSNTGDFLYLFKITSWQFIFHHRIHITSMS